MWNAHFNSLNALRHDLPLSVNGLEVSDSQAVAAFEAARAAAIQSVVDEHGEAADVSITMIAGEDGSIDTTVTAVATPAPESEA